MIDFGAAGTAGTRFDEMQSGQAKFVQGEDIYRARRSLFFKTMHIVRGCDPKRNVVVYLSYTDKLIDGSPQNSTSTVPLMPWGTTPAPKCGDYLNPQ